MASSKFQLPSHFRGWNSSAEHSDYVVKRPTSSGKPLWKRPLCLAAAAAAALIVVIIAIAVPLAVILPKKGKGHATSVILPLYIYPKENATWAPLYDALASHPQITFTVIVNPNSGPGDTPHPNEDYSAALKQLAAYSNVQKVGYVRTGYATRNLSDVISEVNTFNGWTSKDADFAMDGIFFDESPHQYTADAVSFMLQATKAVKDAKDFQADKTVIRNPGVVPDARFSDTNTDISVVFEESYKQYPVKESELSALQDDRSHNCYMVHSLPTMSKDELRGYVDGLSKRAKHLFVTTNDQDYYQSFGSDWADFVDVVPK